MMTEPLDPFTPAANVAFPVRRLRIDLSAGFGRLWAGGDPYRTHHLNALSMSFPVGEQFFIDSVKKGVSLLSTADQESWASKIDGFVGQEATHRFLHAQFNTQLEKQGLVNHWHRWALWRIQRGAHIHPVNHVAITAALEHFTAVLATAVLEHPSWLDDAEPDLALMWRWHAVEESEHKAVAFDLYRAIGGGEIRRILWFIHVGFVFLIEANLQTMINLWRSGHWWRPRTWVCALRFVFGMQGLLWATVLPLLRYLRPSFHPNQLSSAREGAEWLVMNRAMYRVMRE